MKLEGNVDVIPDLEGELRTFGTKLYEGNVDFSLSLDGSFGVEIKLPDATIDFSVLIGGEHDVYIGEFWKPDVPVSEFWVPDAPVSAPWKLAALGSAYGLEEYGFDLYSAEKVTTPSRIWVPIELDRYPGD
jgi:hypothetical protein